MAEPLDLVVIGTGEGGSGPAYRCRRAGWRVAVVDELPYGGTCALRGCDPKKVLVGAAELTDWRRRMEGRGVSGDAHISWPDLMRFKRTFTDPVPADREKAFQQAGISTPHGPARFLSPERLSVDGQVLEARHFVISAGAKPRRLGIPGEEYLLTSTAYLELDQLPPRIAFLGAGYISFEFAHVSRRAGAQATIIGRGKPLQHFEQDLVTRLTDHTRSLGIDVRVDAEVTAIEQRAGRDVVQVHSHGRVETLEAEAVVHGGGRVPNTEGLDLQAANVATEPNGGVRVNEFLQSVSNPRVYAAGDAAASPGSLPLTPVAAYEGVIVASNLLNGNTQRPDYRGIPSVVFTVPALAGVGLTEAEARQRQLDIRVKAEDTSGWYSNRRVAETCAMFKVIEDSQTGRILGAHLLGPHAEEVINLFALGIRSGLPATDLKHLLYAYPTSGADVPYMIP
ncbi:MAG: NAD(P)/FAD-dependent oxidoreductase [Gemmatimonadetes bacterium]|nr:MAG: NAD(P)/FAD-dependent oxidoreductase [Gemmatimonadota bacterium]